MLYTLTNDFHNTTITLRTRTGRLSKRQIDRSRAELCGVEGCTCGGWLGEYGPQTIRILMTPSGGLRLAVKKEHYS